MKHLILIVKGFFVGIALIIPGLSGGTLAIYLGIYEKLLHAIGHVFSELKRSVEFLVPLFLGMGIAIVTLANVIGYLIDINSMVVLVFFIGLILGGLKDIYQKARPEHGPVQPSSMIAFLVSFLLIILLIIFGKLSNETGIAYLDINVGTIVLLVLLGMAASMTMIVPGVSGSALLIVLGYYTAIVTNVAGNIFDFEVLSYNLQVIIPFAIGAAIGIIAFSKLIEFALKKYPSQSYFAIFGFLIGSIVAILFEIKDPATAATHDLQTPVYTDVFGFLGDNLWSLLGALALCVVGYLLSSKLAMLDHSVEQESL